MYEFAENLTSTVKVSVYKNRDGNIQQEGETTSGTESFIFKGFASSITASEIVNDTDSPALHNGISGLVWLFSGTDENFNPLTIEKTTKSEVDYE